MVWTALVSKLHPSIRCRTRLEWQGWKWATGFGGSGFRALLLEDYPRTCKWLGPITPHVFAMNRPFGRGTNMNNPILRGLTISMVINYVLVGMILQGSGLPETENGFIQPAMCFLGDEGHPKFIIWEYDDLSLGCLPCFFPCLPFLV